MKRSVSEIAVGSGLIRYRTKIEDDDAQEQERFIRQFYFMRALADQPDLLNCGYSRFETLRIYWSGNHWIAEAEATMEEAP